MTIKVSLPAQIRAGKAKEFNVYMVTYVYKFCILYLFILTLCILELVLEQNPYLGESLAHGDTIYALTMRELAFLLYISLLNK